MAAPVVTLVHNAAVHAPVLASALAAALASALALGLALGAVACSSRPGATGSSPTPAVSDQLLAPSHFASIADRTERSRKMFVEISRVLTHPRCVNCHPHDDTPRQGENQAVHDPPVLRGPEDRGVPALGCDSCHQDRNAEFARIPGAPGWHLAPRAMMWLGRSEKAICEQLKDRRHNGGRTLAQLQEHFAHDKLVGWGWNPGADRVPAPGTQAQLAALVQAWIETGAACP